MWQSYINKTINKTSRCIKPTCFLQTANMEKIKIYDDAVRTRDERETLLRAPKSGDKNKTVGAGMQ